MLVDQQRVSSVKCASSLTSSRVQGITLNVNVGVRASSADVALLSAVCRFVINRVGCPEGGHVCGDSFLRPYARLCGCLKIVVPGTTGPCLAALRINCVGWTSSSGCELTLGSRRSVSYVGSVHSLTFPEEENADMLAKNRVSSVLTHKTNCCPPHPMSQFSLISYCFCGPDHPQPLCAFVPLVCVSGDECAVPIARDVFCACVCVCLCPCVTAQSTDEPSACASRADVCVWSCSEEAGFECGGEFMSVCVCLCPCVNAQYTDVLSACASDASA